MDSAYEVIVVVLASKTKRCTCYMYMYVVINHRISRLISISQRGKVATSTFAKLVDIDCTNLPGKLHSSTITMSLNIQFERFATPTFCYIEPDKLSNKKRMSKIGSVV